ncbi:MAG: glycogen/starch/alpha-glucan phosphorylase [Magnetococcales bacterium]|nr:glycogen/starch/alpha-glucan phosphorylase [Magnetococcales bacterium]
MNLPLNAPMLGSDLPSSWETSAIKSRLIDNMVRTVGKNPDEATSHDWFYALAYLVRGLLSERYIKMEREQNRRNVRRSYYLSMEYLLGQLLSSNLLALDLLNPVKVALSELGQNYDTVKACELDAGLGNGGLGRLAACILESMATHGYPGYGYSIRYEFGMFHQRVEHGQQVEYPENWLRFGNPWEFERHCVKHSVRFNGKAVTHKESDGDEQTLWVDTEKVMALGYDIPLAGFRANTLVNLRLWSARSITDFNLQDFNEGEYTAAVEGRALSETLSRVLYPNDATEKGQILRLKQEYFFVSASIMDIIERHQRAFKDIRTLPEKVSIHLNDTHPSLAIAELMRILIDDHMVPKAEAWAMTRQVFSYTNHTLMPEALETWPVDMLERIVPRHMALIYWINHQHLNNVKRQFPADAEMPNRLSLIDEDSKRVRMAHLSVVGSHKVNGVAELHTQLMCEGTFEPFHRMDKEWFINVTNGVTQRRWLLQSNPNLASLITARIGDQWITDLAYLKELEAHADDESFLRAFRKVKNQNKKRLAKLIQKKVGVQVDYQSLFDIQVKRIHEYKRQLLNLFSVITRYNRLKEGIASDPLPRTVVIAGKAAPGYFLAKLIIRLINDVAATINSDPDTRDALKLAFLPNYNVTMAETIVPGCDLSEQISTAGSEASGTGNMKFAMNGALTIGTLDGANIEIRESVGKENIFIFGLTAEAAQDLRDNGYNSRQYYEDNLELRKVLDMIRDGFFSPDDPGRYHSLVNAILDGDHYLVCADYASYMACLGRVDDAFGSPEEWTRMAVLNVARMGNFSIDRTVHTYAKDVWNIEPLHPFYPSSRI